MAEKELAECVVPFDSDCYQICAELHRSTAYRRPYRTEKHLNIGIDKCQLLETIDSTSDRVRSGAPRQHMDDGQFG